MVDKNANQQKTSNGYVSVDIRILEKKNVKTSSKTRDNLSFDMSFGKTA